MKYSKELNQLYNKQQRKFSRWKRKSHNKKQDNYEMGMLIGKGKHTMMAGSHPHKNMILEPIIMRGGEYKCRILEIHMKLRVQHLKIMYIYMHIYKNLIVTLPIYLYI